MAAAAGACARSLCSLFGKQPAFVGPDELRSRRIDHVVVVDTRLPAGIRELLDLTADMEPR